MEGTISLNGFNSYIEHYGFFGTTVKRNDDMVEYNFKSYIYSNIALSIKTKKSDAQSIPSPKIVVGILVNGTVCDSWTDFITELKKLTKYNGNRKYKKDYQHHKPTSHITRNNAKNVRVVRKEAR